MEKSPWYKDPLTLVDVSDPRNPIPFLSMEVCIAKLKRDNVIADTPTVASQMLQQCGQSNGSELFLDKYLVYSHNTIEEQSEFVENQKNNEEEPEDAYQYLDTEEIIEREDERLLREAVKYGDTKAYFKVSEKIEKRNRMKQAQNKHALNTMNIDDLEKKAQDIITSRNNSGLSKIMADIKDIREPEELDKLEKRMKKILNNAVITTKEQEKEREILMQYIQAKRDRGYMFFVPNEPQEDCIKTMGAGSYITILATANGTGKTHMAVATLANIIWESNKDWYNYPLFNKFPHKRVGRIITSRHGVNNIIGLIKELFPKDDYIMEKDGKEYFSKITCRPNTEHEFVFDILTYTQSKEQFESVTVGFLLLDEPPAEKAMYASITRLRTGGVILISATAVLGNKNSQFLYRFIHDIEAKKYSKDTSGYYGVYIEGDIHTACNQCSKRGHLDHNDILNMERALSEKERAARVGGVIEAVDFAIFPSFNIDTCVVDPFSITKESHCVVMSIDFHAVKDDMIVWVAIDQYGKKHVIAEISLPFVTFDQYLEEIYKIEKQYDMRVIKRLIDPSSKIDAAGSGGSFMDKLLQRGFSVVEGSKERPDCERVTNAEFASGNLKVFNRCKITITSIQDTVFLDEDGRDRDKKNDDAAEALGRIIYDNSSFVRQTTTQDAIRMTRRYNDDIMRI